MPVNVFPLKLLGAMVSALLLWASFSPGFGFLVWFAVVPFFVALNVEPRLGRKLLLGGLFGFLFFLLEFTGVCGLWYVVGFWGVAAAFLALGILGAFWGAVFAAFSSGDPFRLAGLWALVEFARSSGPWGISIGTSPLALVGMPFLGAAAYLGPWFLSLAIALTNASLARLFIKRSMRWLTVALLGPAVLVALSRGIGPDFEDEMDVFLVQPGITVPQRWGLSIEGYLRRYKGLLAEAPQGVDLVVFPEDSLPGFLLEDQRLLDFLRREAARLNSSILIGSWERWGESVRNAAFLVKPSGEITVVHRKTRLLPFGEYIPLRWLLGRIGLAEVLSRYLPRDISPGKGYSPHGDLGVLICSETMFPDLSRELISRGARVLVALTNDSWFGTSRILWEHFACGSLRAAETGRAFLQAAITGITGGFGPDGRPLGIPLRGKESGTLT
ncbi:TPA: apolipoprotein N-acyltransferase, partial [Candidatus Micrarchaeota archaeon]|nr:apolipoprotein N-acyltransferase [Candidatus Micrarchaeota archaeon]